MIVFKHLLLIIVSIIPLILKSQSYCDFIQKVQNYQDDVKLEQKKEYSIIDPKTFNIRTYLSLFDKIEVEKGFRIDVYFFDNVLDGNPYLYALKEDEFIVDKRKKVLYTFLNKPEVKAKNHVIPKDTELGFLQYLFFYEMGEQFALWWHSNYMEKRIICSRDNLNKVINYLKKSEAFSVDTVELKKLKEINPEITVTGNEKYYIISWLENRTHRGIYRCSYQIDRNSPYAILKIKEAKLLQISPNFLY